MAVKIRLKRLGTTRSPHYRIVVADSRTKRDGRAIEEIGRYVPTEHPSIIEVNSERAQYWLSVGAQPTEQVAVLLKLTGDFQASKGEKAVNTVKVKEAKAEFVLDTKKKAVLLPKEEKKAKVEEAPVVETAAVVEDAPVAEEAAVVEEAPVAEDAPVAEEVVEAPAEEAVAEAVVEEAAVEAEATESPAETEEA